VFLLRNNKIERTTGQIQRSDGEIEGHRTLVGLFLQRAEDDRRRELGPRNKKLKRNTYVGTDFAVGGSGVGRSRGNGFREVEHSALSHKRTTREE
jgi:hypothetical protein